MPGTPFAPGQSPGQPRPLRPPVAAGGPAVPATAPFDAQFNTKLSPAGERQFQSWKARYAPQDSGADYDLRGAFKAGLRPDPATGHWPDTFKKPNHPTFSDQSRYAPYGQPGHWNGEQYVPPSSAAAGALRQQLARESLFIDQENHNLKSLEGVIRSGQATAAEVQSYQERGAAQQERVRRYQALNAQYQGLPAAQVPLIPPRQYHPPPEAAALASIEPVYQKWGKAPASPVEIARVKQQYGVAQAGLARTFSPRLAQHQADGAALKAQGAQLDQLAAQAKAGELSPATLTALQRALRQHQTNVTAFNQERAALINQAKRFDQFTQGHAREDLHLGMVYPEEVGGPGPSAAVRAFKATLNFFQPVSAAAARNLPAARRGLQLAGTYPPLPDLPANVTGAAREALIRQKNDLVAMVTREQDPTHVAGYSPVLTYDPTTNRMTSQPGAAFDERALTPFQRQLLPVVRQQVKAELRAREIAGTEQAGLIDAAALAGSLLVGGFTSRIVGTRLAARFLPLLYPALEAPVLPSLPQVAARLLAARAIPVLGAHIAGSVAGGATGAAISAGLVGPPKFDPKTGKPLTPTLGERAAYAGEAALRSVPPSALIGTLWGAASLLGGTLAPFLKGHYDAETGPAANAAFTAEAEARAAQAGYPLSPEESGRFAQRFGQIQRAPLALKPKLWRDLAHDWNTFIQQQRLLRPPGEPGPAGTEESGGLGPPQPQLPSTPRTQFDLPENVGPLVRTPAGQDWDLRTRPVEDIQQLHAQFGQLKAAGQLTPEQDAEYGRLDRWLQGHHDYQAQQALPGATGEAQTAIHTALLEGRSQYGLAALDQAQTAAQGRGDLYLAGELHRALGEQAGVVTQAFNSQLAPPGTPGIETPLPPLFASVFRTLAPERLAQVPPAARRVLLLQDLNNSIAALQPGAQPFFRPPEGIKSDAELQALADSYYRLASLHLSSLFPAAFQPAPPAAPAAAPEPAPVAGAPLTLAGLVPGAVVQFPNGLTVQLTGPADAGGLGFHATVMDPGHSSYVAGSTATLARDNLIAGGTLVSPGGAPSTPSTTPPETATPIGSPSGTPAGGAIPASPTGGILPPTGTPSPPSGLTTAPGTTGPAGPLSPPGAGGALSAPPSTAVERPPGATLPSIPTAPPPSAAASERPLTPADLRPGVVVKSANTGIESELKERRPDGKWQARVISVPATARGNIRSGSLREIPESALLEPGRYVTSEALPPEGQPSTAPPTTETSVTSAPTTGPATPPSPSGSGVKPTPPVSPPLPPPSPAPPSPVADTSPTGALSPPTTEPSGTPLPPAPRTPAAAPTTLPANELPRPVRLLIDALLDRINARMLADEAIFSNNVELEQFAAPLLGGSRAAGTYTAQTVYNALEAAVNRYVVEQQFGQQSVGEALKHLQDLLKALPTQTLRAGDKDALQQFSTPPTLALLAAYALRAQPGESLLEPSAGTGSLLALAQSIYGTQGRRYDANEIDPERRAILFEYFTSGVYAADARYLNATLPHGLTYDLILMNPPFSAAQGQRAKNTNEIGFEHVEQALKRLKEGGRLVAILGRGASFEHSTAMPFWNKVIEQYHARANAGLPGKDYQKYGTSFATQLVIIDNAGPTPGGLAAVWAPELTSVEAVIEGLNERGILDRPTGPGKAPSVGTGAAGAPGERGGAVGAAPAGGRREPGRGQRPGRQGVAVPAEPPAPGPAVPARVPGTAPGTHGGAGEPAGSHPAPDHLREPGHVGEPGAAGGPAAPQPAGGEPDRHLAAPLDWLFREGTILREKETGEEFRVTANRHVVLGADLYAAESLKDERPILIGAGRGAEYRPEQFDLVQPGPLFPDEVKPGALLEHPTVGDVIRVLERRHDPTLPDRERDRVEIEYLQVPHPDGIQRGDRRTVPLTHLLDNYRLYRPTEGGLFAAPAAATPPPSTPAPAPAKKLAKKKAATPEAIQPEERQDVGDQYVTYLPAYVLEGRPHPAAMVETRSLAAVDPPPLTVTHRLQEATLYPTPELAEAYARLTKKPVPDPESLGLSRLQLENVLYAIQQHETILPDGSRAALLIGDLTGAGKGRSQAAIIADAWDRGVKRQVWFSMRAGLLDAAKDDLAAIGYGHIPLRLLNTFPGGEPMPADFEGIVFSTYQTLTQTAKSGSLVGLKRRQVLERWLTGAGDTKGDGSLILFDESHALKNSVQRPMGQPPSERAIEAMLLQDNLPLARVVYASATAMTDLDNMAYLKRLGLWGPGTPFPGGFNDFARDMEGGGRGYMEMIARSMKARGRYLSRGISYRDPENRPQQSVEYRTLSHAVSGEDKRQYDLVAQAWQVVLQNMDAAIAITGGGSQARRQALGRFWGDHQRFFRRFLTALKLPTLYADIDRQLAAGHSVIISLTSTGEAAVKDAIRDAQASGLDLEELHITPIQALVSLVESAFPVQRWVEKQLADTEQTILEPLVDADGNPVLDPEAVGLRDRLLERLAAITERLPGNPLDEILFRYGHDKVAEISGRGRRLEPGAGGELTYVSRGGDGINVREKDRFNAGEKRIGIITPAGNEGISLHADRRFANQERRTQYMFELNYAADAQMQANGRSHRSNQTSAPELVIAQTDIGGESRFGSSLAARLSGLGALTQGERGATGAGGLLERLDFNNDYGAAALGSLYRHVFGGGQIEGLAQPRQALRDMGLIRQHEDGTEALAQGAEVDVMKFFNRLLALEVDRQNPLFAAFVSFFDRIVAAAKANGEFDFGVQDIRGTNLREAAPAQVVHTDPTTGAQTTYHHVVADEPSHPVTLPYLINIPDALGFYRRNSDQKLVFFARTDSPVNPNRMVTPTNVRAGSLSSADLARNFTRLPDSQQVAAGPLWQAEVDEIPPTVPRHYHLIAGDVLGLFDRLRSTGLKELDVRRAKLPGNVRVVGIALPVNHAKRILRALGATAGAVNPAELYQSILAGGEEFPLVSGLSLKRATVGGQKVVSIRGLTDEMRVDLQRQEYPSERSGATYRHTVWLPADPVRGPEFLARLLQRFPPLEELPPAAGSRPSGVGSPELPTAVSRLPSARERGLKLLSPGQVPLHIPPRWRMPFDTQRWLEQQGPALSNLFRDLAAAGLPPDLAARAHDFGILLWPEVVDPGEKGPSFIGGLSAPVWGPNGEAVGRAVFVNPFPTLLANVKGAAAAVDPGAYQGLKESPDPTYVAERILGAMLHELAHQDTEAEGVPLLEAASRIRERLGEAGLKEVRDGIRRAITGSDGKLSAGYLAGRAAYYARARADRRPRPTLGAEAGPGGGRALTQTIGGGGPLLPPPPGGDGRELARREREGHRTTAFRFPWPGLEQQFGGARPGPPPTRWLELKAALPVMLHALQRPFAHLPVNDPVWAELRYKLHEFEHGWGIANMNAVLSLAQILGQLSPADHSFFNRMVYVLDLEEEVAEQTAAIVGRLGPDATPEQLLAHIQLPQGDGSPEQAWTPERVAEAAALIRAELEKPENRAAAEAREIQRLVIDQVMDRLLSARKKATGKELLISRREWFHHEILFYTEEYRRQQAARGGKRFAPATPGFMRHREGSVLDYNSDYIGAMLAWLPTALFDAHAYELLAWLRDTYDVKKFLQQAAVLINDAQAYRQLEETAAALNAQARAGKPITAEDLYLSQYNAPIARGFGWLGRLAYEQRQTLPGYDDPRWEDLIEEIAAKWYQGQDARDLGLPTPKIDDEHARTLFDYFRWLLQPPQAGQPGSGAAAMIFKGIAQKKARLKAALGREHVTWRDLLKHPFEVDNGDGTTRTFDFTGYVAWQPEEGQALYRAWGVRERIANAVIAAGTESLGIPITPDDLRHLTVVGGRKPEWVIPKPLALTLKNLKNPVRDEFEVLWGKLASAAKQWILLNPLHYLAYHTRNELTDIEAVGTGNPYSFGYMKAAYQELYDFMWRGNLPSDHLRGWLDRGGILSTLQAASTDRRSVGTIQFLRQLQEDRSLTDRTWGEAWRRARIAGDLREAVLRYASYLSYLDQMLTDPHGRPLNFGASYEADIMAIGDVHLRAYVLSNELLGAYDQVPALWKKIRKGLPMPFVNWKIVNTRRYLRLMVNEAMTSKGFAAYAQGILMNAPLPAVAGGGAGQSPPGLPPGGGGGGGGGAGSDGEEAERRRRLHALLRLRNEARRRRLGWQWIAAALGVGPVFLGFVLRWFVKASWLNTLAAANNWAFHSDEERRLPPYVRNKPHLDLGFNRYIDRISGFGDALGSFGLDDIGGYWEKYRNGRMNAWDVLADMFFRQPVQTIVDQVGLPKNVAELAAGVKFFPDFTHPRPIDDKWEYAMTSVGLGNAYRLLWRLPQRGGFGSLGSQATGWTDFNPGESQYNEVRELAFDWSHQHGFGDIHTSGLERSRNAYFFKKSLKNGDPASGLRFLLRYQELGGDDKGLELSLKYMYPLYRWQEGQRRQFLLSMKGEEPTRWRNAMLFLYQSLAPQAPINQGELDQKMKAPLLDFDRWIWSRTEAQIDRGGWFADVDRAHPEARAAGEAYKKKVEGR